MEFQNGAGLEGYRNPETSSPTLRMDPILTLPWHKARSYFFLVNR